MYEADSFFTLGTAERLGLLVLSAVLTLGVLYMVFRLARGRRAPVRFAIAAMAFIGFVWLSPQVYYTYYRLIFDGLPSQWVIDGPPSFLDLAAIVTFSGRTQLSDHGQGVLFWAMIGLALWARPAKAENAPEP